MSTQSEHVNADLFRRVYIGPHAYVLASLCLSLHTGWRVYVHASVSLCMCRTMCTSQLWVSLGIYVSLGICKHVAVCTCHCVCACVRLLARPVPCVCVCARTSLRPRVGVPVCVCRFAHVLLCVCASPGAATSDSCRASRGQPPRPPHCCLLSSFATKGSPGGR